MAKQEHVPGMRETTVRPNREARRHPEQLEDEALTRDRDVRPDVAVERSPDVPSPRAKSSGHGKKTADKWNQ